MIWIKCIRNVFLKVSKKDLIKKTNCWYLIILLKATSLLQYDYISHIYIWIISNEYRLYSPTVHPYCVFYLLVARFISKSASFYPKLGNKSIDSIILTRWQIGRFSINKKDLGYVKWIK